MSKNKLRVVCNFNGYNTMDIDTSGSGNLASIEINSQFTNNEILFDITKKDAKKVAEILLAFANN